MIGGVPGAAVGVAIGFFAGAVIQVIKMSEPKFFDDPVQGTKNIINNVGKGIEGYSDEEEGRFLEVYEKWTKTLTVPRKEIK